MNVNSNTRSMTEAAILTALFCVFSLAGLYIPLLSFLLAVMPAPLIVLGVRRGVRYTIMTLVASTLILVMVSNPVIALLSVTLPSLSAIIVTYLIRKEKTHLIIILSGAMSFAVTTAITLYANFRLMGINMIELMNQSVEESIAQQTAIIENFNLVDRFGVSPDAIAESTESIRAAMELLKDAVPVMIIMSAFMLMVLNYVIALKVLKRTGTKVNELPKFRYYRLPKEAMTGMLVIYLLTFLVSRTDFVNQDVLLLNVFMIVQYVFVIQGIAVAIYFMHQYKLNNIVKAIVLIILLASGTGAMLFFFVGAIDIFLDIRRFKPEINES